MNKTEDESITENKNAIESFFQRGWGFVRYDENGLHFLDDEEVMNEVIHDFFYDYKKSIVYIRKVLKTAEELDE